MPSPEWLIERGIGETRAALIENGQIAEARIELDGAIPAGTVIKTRLATIGANGRNALAVGEEGVEYLLPLGAAGATEGAVATIEVTREAIPGAEPWKRPIARITDRKPGPIAPLAERLGGRLIAFPNPRDELEDAGWEDLLDQARTATRTFAGGELRISPTPAMTLIDVDGYLAVDELAVVGAAEAARSVRRLDIGGSIGIDLPTSRSKPARQAAGLAIDDVLLEKFERTAVNGFGFVQIVRPRRRASLVELAQDRALFEVRSLLRRAAMERAGPRTLVAHPALINVLELRPAWITMLARQLGGAICLRAEPSLPMSAGYAEAA